MKKLILLSVLIVGVGCDPSVDAIREKSDTYSIYGALNIYADTNYIRVRNLSDPLTKSATKNLNIDVKLVDVERGFERSLSDSVRLVKDVYTHNFISAIDIRPYNKYEAIIIKNGEERLRETAVTPKITSPDVEPVRPTCREFVTISFSKIVGLVDVAIGVEYHGEYEFFEYRRRPDSSQTEVRIFTTPEDLIVRALGANVANQDGNEIRCHDLSDNVVKVKYTVYGPGFFEGVHGEQLELPDKLGRFGGFYRDQFEFELNTRNVYPGT